MARILLGVSGSIAAYRSPDLVKVLKAKGHEIQTVLTRSGAQFVTAKTLETFSGKKVLTNDPWSEEHQGTDHISHARWAEVFIIYGATANLMAKLANGICDDFLTLQILATTAPVMLVPAMNVEMWKNQATQENYKKLLARGFQFAGPVEGNLACGEVGLGHIAELADINFVLEDILENKVYGKKSKFPSYFQDKKVLVSLGSMKTDIDDVRFIQNKSTGRMGIEIAKSLTELGAKVQLLAGLVDAEVEIEFSSFTYERFASFSEYQQKLRVLFPQCDVFLSLAAVLDFEVRATKGKLERGLDSLALEVVPTADLVAWSTSHKRAEQKVVAFSLEAGPTWPDCLERAQKKLAKKNADLIVVNRSGLAGEGPESDTNSLCLLTRKGKATKFALSSKGEIAWRLCRELSNYFSNESKKNEHLGPDLQAT